MSNQVLLRRTGMMSDPSSVEAYTSLGGFRALKKALGMSKEAILDEVDVALLRGRGGAAFPAGRKWRHLFENPRYPQYIVCNADEGEPGTFKDRLLLEQDPLSVIEGMIIAAYVFDAEEGFIYIRGEYRDIQNAFQRALDQALAAGYLGENILGVEGFNYRITIISGAGAYVCGENSALLNSIEGLTGRPRVKPPHLADVGLHKQPTLVNNVESFACIPVIVSQGGKAFLELGTEQGGGTKLVCLSGCVKNRGVYEVELGIPLHEILYSEEYGGGLNAGCTLGFIHFGGQSGAIGFPEDIEEMTYSYEGLWEKKLAIGSGALVVMDESVGILDYLESVAGFFVHESCGKCTPCRLGTTRLLELIRKFNQGRARTGDIERLEEMLEHITNLSACGLGQSVSVAFRSVLRARREEFEKALG